MRMSNRVRHIFNLRNIKRPSRPETQTQTRSWTTPPPKHDPYYSGIDGADDIENAIHISEEEDFSPSSADDASITTPPNSNASSSSSSSSSSSRSSRSGRRTKNGSKGTKSQAKGTCQRKSQTHSKSDGKKGRTVRIITWQVDELNSGQERPRCRWTIKQERELGIAYQELARCQKAWSSEQEIWLKYIKVLTEEKEAHEGFLHSRAKQQDDERVHFRKACRRQQQQQQQEEGESPMIRRPRTTTLTTLTSLSSASASSDSEDGNGNGNGVKLERNRSLRGLGRLRRRLSSMD